MRLLPPFLTWCRERERLRYEGGGRVKGFLNDSESLHDPATDSEPELSRSGPKFETERTVNLRSKE